MTDLLLARGLNRRFGGIHALRNVDVAQGVGETLGMIGPNGSGKSSFVNAVNGQLRLDSGTVSVAGKAITGRPPHVATRMGLARTYQAVRVFTRLPVRENLIASGLLHHRDAGALLADTTTREILSWLQLDQSLGRIAGDLTLFEQRRLELAMRLVLRPKLIMLDEPVGGLAPGEVRTMMQLLAELKQRCAIFVIEHTMQVIRALADRVIVLIAGEKVADAPPADVLRDRRVIEHYLGAAHA